MFQTFLHQNQKVFNSLFILSFCEHLDTKHKSFEASFDLHNRTKEAAVQNNDHRNNTKIANKEKSYTHSGTNQDKRLQGTVLE